LGLVAAALVVMGAARHLQISNVAVYTILALLCLLPAIDLCAAAAWER
jgi:hypothetical protein